MSLLPDESGRRWELFAVRAMLICIATGVSIRTLADQPAAPLKEAPQATKVVIPVSLKRAALVKISMDVKDADVVQLVGAVNGQILKATNHPLTINTMLRTYRASLKVTDVPAEDVLRAVAALGHGSLCYSENGFVLADPRMIRPDQRKQLVPAPLPAEVPQSAKR